MYVFGTYTSKQRINAIDVKTESVNSRNGALVSVLDGLDYCRRMIEQVPTVHVKAQRYALMRVAAVGQVYGTKDPQTCTDGLDRDSPG
jgi:hypothetical protein